MVHNPGGFPGILGGGLKHFNTFIGKHAEMIQQKRAEKKIIANSYWLMVQKSCSGLSHDKND